MMSRGATKSRKKAHMPLGSFSPDNFLNEKTFSQLMTVYSTLQKSQGFEAQTPCITQENKRNTCKFNGMWYNNSIIHHNKYP